MVDIDCDKNAKQHHIETLTEKQRANQTTNSYLSGKHFRNRTINQTMSGFSVDYLTSPTGFPGMPDFSELPSPNSLFGHPVPSMDHSQHKSGATEGNSSWLMDSSLLGSHHANLSSSDSAFFNSSCNSSFPAATSRHLSSAHSEESHAGSVYTVLCYKQH